MMLFVVPVVLGDGIPLFQDIGEEVSFRLRESKSYGPGLVKLHYDLDR
jgi:dihydrofolate reductase